MRGGTACKYQAECRKDTIPNQPKGTNKKKKRTNHNHNYAIQYFVLGLKRRRLRLQLALCVHLVRGVGDLTARHSIYDNELKCAVHEKRKHQKRDEEPHA